MVYNLNIYLHKSLELYEKEALYLVVSYMDFKTFINRFLGIRIEQFLHKIYTLVGLLFKHIIYQGRQEIVSSYKFQSLMQILHIEKCTNTSFTLKRPLRYYSFLPEMFYSSR